MKVAHILQENLKNESFRGCCFHESWCNPPHKVCTFIFSSSSLIFTNNIAYSTELVLETGGVSIAPPAQTHTITTTSTLPPTLSMQGCQRCSDTDSESTESGNNEDGNSKNKGEEDNSNENNTEDGDTSSNEDNGKDEGEEKMLELPLGNRAGSIL